MGETPKTALSRYPTYKICDRATFLHELAHLYGFIEGYARFNGLVDAEGLFIGDDFTATLDGEHLDKSVHSNDWLNTHLLPEKVSKT